MAFYFNGKPAELCWCCHRPFALSHWMDRLCASCRTRDAQREQFQEAAANPPEPQVTCPATITTTETKT